jgi:hypothetical protein
MPSTNVTVSHVTQGRVRIHITLRYGREVGFMGGIEKEYNISTLNKINASILRDYVE